jgi:hypothetical protein
VRSSAYGSRFRVQGLESGNVDPMRATTIKYTKIKQEKKMTWIALCHSTSCNYLAKVPRFAHDTHFWLSKEMSDVLRNER